MIDDPIDAIEDIISRARRDGDEFADAAVLASAGRDRRPSARMVLVKQIHRDGLVFYTNLGSRKARELEANPRASLCFFWPRYQIQVRVEGTASPVADEAADTYFASRPRGSQIGAWASKQSDVLPDRDTLIEAVNEAAKRFHGGTIPRPPHWSGFAVVPKTVEIWYGRPDRLHERRHYTRTRAGWKMTLLWP